MIYPSPPSNHIVQHFTRKFGERGATVCEKAVGGWRRALSADQTHSASVADRPAVQEETRTRPAPRNQASKTGLSTAEDRTESAERRPSRRCCPPTTRSTPGEDGGRGCVEDEDGCRPRSSTSSPRTSGRSRPTNWCVNSSR